MSSLTDLFNPTFIMFLGILLLGLALLVLYYENKIREQNHKLSSMLYLVSSLAEEVNMVKIHLNTNTMVKNNVPFKTEQQNLEKNNLNNLIQVSDDELDLNDEVDLDSDSQSDSDSDSENGEYNNEQNHEISVIKLDNDEKYNDIIEISNNLENDNDNLSESSEDELDLESLNDLNEEDNDDKNNDDKNNDDKNNELQETTIEDLNNSSFKDIISHDLKNIEINNLDEIKDSEQEQNDYKKFSLSKLRNLVIERNLTLDASKLKKSELIKMLEE
jgi:hypothetical protein